MKLKKVLLTLACAGVFLGCSEQKPKEDVSAPASYMHDKAFMKQLDERKTLRDQLLGKRFRIEEELQAEKARDPSSARAKELQAELDKCDNEFEKNRKETYAIVRERLNRKDGGKK